MNFISKNIGTIIVVLGALISTISAWVVIRTSVIQLQKDLEEERGERRKLAEEVKHHQTNTSLHIDPDRDRKIWEDFKLESWKRFDRLEEKIEKAMLFIVPPTAK